MRERTRRHDDVHFPMGGRGKAATPPTVERKTRVVLMLDSREFASLCGMASGMGDVPLQDVVKFKLFVAGTPKCSGCGEPLHHYCAPCQRRLES